MCEKTGREFTLDMWLGERLRESTSCWECNSANTFHFLFSEFPVINAYYFSNRRKTYLNSQLLKRTCLVLNIYTHN